MWPYIIKVRRHVHTGGDLGPRHVHGRAHQHTAAMIMCRRSCCPAYCRDDGCLVICCFLMPGLARREGLIQRANLGAQAHNTHMHAHARTHTPGSSNIHVHAHWVGAYVAQS